MEWEEVGYPLLSLARRRWRDLACRNGCDAAADAPMSIVAAFNIC